MVATAPGEKLLIGHRPVRNWTQLQFFSLFQQKLLPPELHFLTPICTNRLSAGAFHWGELTALPQTFQLHLRGLLLKSWWRGTVVERRSLAGELSLSCARPAADG